MYVRTYRMLCMYECVQLADHSFAYNVLLQGRKEWIVLPPRDAIFSGMVAHDFIKGSRSNASSAPQQFFRCMQGPGEAILLPGERNFNLFLSLGEVIDARLPCHVLPGAPLREVSYVC